MIVEKCFPPTAEAPRAVRRWVRELLHEERVAPLEHAAALVVTELVTNAVLHARTPVTVVVELAGDRVRISVADESPVGPKMRTYDTESTTGRGLHLVNLLAFRWGLEERGRGKAIWCELVASSEADATSATMIDERDCPPGRAESVG